MAVMLKSESYYVHTSMVDIYDKVRPASVLDFFQDAASDHAKELGVGFDDLFNLGLYWVILYEEFEMMNSYIPFGSTVKTSTWPKSRTRLEFEREYMLEAESGELIAKGISTWCVIGVETRKLERADRVVFNGEYYTKTNYPDKVNRKIIIPDVEPILEYDHKVLYSDLDHNMHMNNAKYLDIIYNMHVDDRKIKKCRISFVNEAHVNEIIHVLYKKNNGFDYYIGMIGDKQCFVAEIVTEE